MSTETSRVGVRAVEMSAVEDSKLGQSGQTDESVDDRRRDAMVRLAKYTAPAMLALLLSSKQSAVAISVR